MEFELRRATVNDATAIARVQIDSWRSTYAGLVPDSYLQSLDAEDRAAGWTNHLGAGSLIALVAHDPEGIFGFACGGKLRGELASFDAELYAIYLLQRKQRFGAGTALAVTLAAALRIEGHTSMAVWVLRDNLPAVNFYRRLGGIQIAEKLIEIGGAELPELALGWPALELKTR
jgi:GNAT superfamily N-acetyltransferase